MQTTTDDFDLPFSCSPTASAGDNGIITVSYTVTVDSPSITLAGGLLASPGTSYLIGQQLTATTRLPFQLTASSWAWSVTGGDPFKSFAVDDVPGTLHSTGHRVDLSQTDLSASQLACCFANAPASPCYLMYCSCCDAGGVFAHCQPGRAVQRRDFDCPPDGSRRLYRGRRRPDS